MVGSRYRLGDDDELGSDPAYVRFQLRAQRRDRRPIDPRYPLERRSKADDAGQIGRPGAPSAFLSATRLARDERNAGPREKRAHPHGPAELVGRDSHRIRPEGFWSTVEFARCLDRIHVHPCPMGARKTREFGHRLDRARLVVGELTGHERGAVLKDEPLGCSEIHNACCSNRNARRLRDRFENAAVLDRRNQDRSARLVKCELIGLGAAAREHHPIGIDPEAARDGAPGSSRRARARRPKAWTEAGLPTSRSASATAATASGRTGAVAAQSR